jgi:hypothetical protein
MAGMGCSECICQPVKGDVLQEWEARVEVLLILRT